MSIEQAGPFIENTFHYEGPSRVDKRHSHTKKLSQYIIGKIKPQRVALSPDESTSYRSRAIAARRYYENSSEHIDEYLPPESHTLERFTYSLGTNRQVRRRLFRKSLHLIEAYEQQIK